MTRSTTRPREGAAEGAADRERSADGERCTDRERSAPRDAAAHVECASSDLLFGMGDSLRTPLLAILGYTQQLAHAGLSGEDAENVIRISRSGRQLLDLVNQAVDVAAVESGRRPLSPEPVEPGRVVAEGVDLVRQTAVARGIELRPPAGTDPGPPVLADRDRLVQVLVTLLSDAVKHNHRGGRVRIGWRELHADADAADDGADAGARGRWLRFEVGDTGPGIPTDLRSGTGRGVAGTLTEAMGGRIGVTRAAGGGSTFHVDLPLA